MLDGMTNIKASEVLKELKDYIEDLPHYSPDEVAEALDMAIKVLGQSSFINKPCVSEGVCREDKIQVLEKIKAEINTMPCAITSMREVYVNRDKVINILDKYKAESEGGE